MTDRLRLRLSRLIMSLLQSWLHESSQRSQPASRSVPDKQVTSKLVFKFLDRSRQGRLGDIGGTGCVGEVSVLADGKKIPDLVHFHRHILRHISFQAIKTSSIVHVYQRIEFRNWSPAHPAWDKSASKPNTMHFKSGDDHESANPSDIRRTGSVHNFCNCTGQRNGK